jgi:hypothetical protein
MSDFGVVTPNDPSPSPGHPQNHAKTSRGTPPGTGKMPQKILRPRVHFSKLNSPKPHQITLNKLGYKREVSERFDNTLDPKSAPLQAVQ